MATMNFIIFALGTFRGIFVAPKGAKTMTDQVLDLEKVVWTKRVRIMPVDDLLGAIRAIVDDWGGEDVLSAKTTPALVLADLCYYAGIDAAEALGPELADQLKRRGVL